MLLYSPPPAKKAENGASKRKSRTPTSSKKANGKTNMFPCVLLFVYNL